MNPKAGVSPVEYISAISAPRTKKRIAKIWNVLQFNEAMPLYFDAAHLPPPTPEYVAWVDVMGTQVSLSRSLPTSANFIFKLHIAALQAANQNITLYPVMDGLYAASANQGDILDFLRSIFEEVAVEFNSTNAPQHRFIIRGALAFGPVVHGRNVQPPASHALAGNTRYRDSILLGLPMVQAHLSERNAPPFGVFVHDSARSFAPAGNRPVSYVWWPWKDTNNQNTWTSLGQNLNQHFDWCADRAMPLDYASDRIKVHKEMATQYFI